MAEGETMKIACMNGRECEKKAQVHRRRILCSYNFKFWLRIINALENAQKLNNISIILLLTILQIESLYRRKRQSSD